MQAFGGTDPTELRVGLGPSIGAPRYEVGPEVLAAYEASAWPVASAFTTDTAGRLTLDVAHVIQHQLAASGVPDGHVERIAGCTYEEEALWFSHRRDGPATGRHALVAGWTKA